MSMLSRRALVEHLAGVRYASPRAKTPLGEATWLGLARRAEFET